ncbi:MAG TPA: hypothetical protein VF184_13055 [Phycisphaeraceae bacterium]
MRAYGEFGPRKGNILLIRPGETFQQIVPGVCMNHIGTTPCGRYFHADSIGLPAPFGEPGRIIVGSPKTGRFVDVCLSHSKTSEKYKQEAHPHAYLSPDFRWVVFNSIRTGKPETYVASIPPELLVGLDESPRQHGEDALFPCASK